MAALAIIATTVSADTSGAKFTPLFPRAIAPGDTIAIVAPAKYLDRGRVALAVKRLEEMGYKIKQSADLFRQDGYLAGPDSARADELMRAFADPEVDAIFPGTGGYGTTRILDRLDYELIRQNPKVFIGFSDITALHIAIHQRSGLVTFHSPLPEWGLGSKEGMMPFAAHWFWRAILARKYNPTLTKSMPGYTIETRLGPPKATASKSTQAQRALLADVPTPVVLRGGKAHGRLTGGNLSVLHAMMGTPYEIQTEDRILFLEDVGEAPYRIDRMLCTLRLAGKFDHLAGVILGHFTARENEAKWDDDKSMDDVLAEYFTNLNIPVVNHFPVGHVRYNATLPVGAMAELDADQVTLRILENPVRLP